MNYFELFEFPVSLKVDKSGLAKKYFELQKKFHPDFYTNENEEAKEEALEKSSMINKAFKIFQNTDATIKYVLQLKGLLEEEEKYVLPPDFLMEMLEINEQLAEAKFENDGDQISGLKSKISAIESEIYEPVQQIVEHYKEGVSSKEELLQVKDYYYKKKYLSRILQGLD
mgnify:CR=1 FL=1